jgi:hypothetical protein
MYENGTNIWSNGVEYHGVNSLGGGWWIAFVKNDPGMVLRMILEDAA